MVFGTNGGFQWKNSSGTVISGLNSSGDMTLSGGLTLGSQQSVVWTNTASGSVGSFTAVQYSNRFAMFPSSNSNAFTIENTSLDNIFTVALASSSVGTLHNTLDNGSGDMTVAGSITVNSGGTMTIGVSGMTFKGDANNPSILISDTANSNYNITIGQASSNGAYFTSAMTGDSIIRGNNTRLLLGVTAEEAGLMITSGYAVTTFNNTLDDGSGNLTILGTGIGGFAQFFNSGTLRPSSLPFTYSVTIPAGTWAGFIQVDMFMTPSSSAYSYIISVSMSGSGLVSGSTYGFAPLTDIQGGSGGNYPQMAFPPLPLKLETTGGSITFSINNANNTSGMTSIFSGNSDQAFNVSIFLVSTSSID
jgi:hypothetical protein